MLVTPYRTQLIKPNDDLLTVITEVIPTIPEQSVLAIASKAFSFAENRLVPKVTGSRQEKVALVIKEAELYTDPKMSKYFGITTIKHNVLFWYAGVDESNSAHQYTLWPKDPQQSLNLIWQRVKNHYHLNNLGVIMTDSTAHPLTWGVIGRSVVHSGFKAIKDYRGQKDLYQREFVMEQLNLSQSFAAAAAVEMGEGAERQPLALITDIKQDVEFQNQPPSPAELEELNVSIEDDAYAPLLQGVNWKQGGSSLPQS